jgi:acyl-CoA reductase-like NAD-dependent aldehyde dehydrogenase
MTSTIGTGIGTLTHQQYIDGAWTDAADGGTFDVHNPYTGEVYAQVAAGGADDARRAVDAAERAFPAWAALPPGEKQQLFLRAAEIVKRRHAELAAILAEETGCSIFFADFQQGVVQGMLRHAANWVYQPRGEVLESDFAGTFSTAIRRPLGVVASFTPWNGANVLGWRAIISPIAAGNTVVVKPSEEAPISAGLVMAQVAEEAGFPAGVINVVTHAPGAAGPIADVFYDRPEVRCINFIGSARTARMLAQRAGATLKRSVMELGGYNPMIVLADADLDYAVRVATFSAFFHQGQVCLCARKIIVERSIYDEFLARLVERARSLPLGDPRDAATVIGPLINDRAVRAMRDRIADAVGKGARVVTGGGSVGRVHEPTILVDVPDDAEAAYEETFGPLLVVQPVDDAEQAVEVANQHRYGLTSSILTGDTFRGLELAARIKSGAVHVNIPTIDDETQAPIGGVRDSGWGRSGPRSLDDFTDLVWVNAQSGQRHLPL